MFEPLVGELFRSGLVQQAAPRNGDFVTPTVIGAEEYDYAERDLRYTRPMFHLLTNDREFADHNKGLLQGWLATWTGRAHRRRPDAAADVVAARRQAAALRGRPGRGQEPLRRHPHRPQPRRTEGAGPVTTFQHPESPFKSDNTASNMAGVTLMNNQVGAVVAQVMAQQAQRHGHLPAVDDPRRRRRAGWTSTTTRSPRRSARSPATSTPREFEENMSTHYGRMIHQDDRTIMFANPEDAAEYLGFDLVARS